MKIEEGPESAELRFASRHRLFVEGAGEDSLDVIGLKVLLQNIVRIEPLGPSYSVKSVAQALHPYHPSYYFLIDRDPHHDDGFVDHCWSNFPDPATHNLLVWKRREIENYFLDPSYLVQSRFCTVDKAKLEEKLTECATHRLFLDAANWVLIGVRDGQKRNWIQIFKESDNLATADAALDRLKTHPGFAARTSEVTQSMAQDELERLFGETVQAMTGGSDNLSLGMGNWIGMIRGKKVFAQLANSSCFVARTNDGTVLQGPEKSHEIVKDLLRQDIAFQPPDFIKLKTLIEKRVQSG